MPVGRIRRRLANGCLVHLSDSGRPFVPHGSGWVRSPVAEVLEGSSLLMDEEGLREGVRKAQEALAQAVAALESSQRQDDLQTGAARLFRERRRRDELFPPGLFVEPEWDVLLVLAQRGSTRQIELFNAVNVPHTTGLRVLERLLLAALVERSTDQRVARSNLISLSKDGRKRMQQLVGPR